MRFIVPDESGPENLRIRNNNESSQKQCPKPISPSKRSNHEWTLLDTNRGTVVYQQSYISRSRPSICRYSFDYEQNDAVAASPARRSFVSIGGFTLFCYAQVFLSLWEIRMQPKRFFELCNCLGNVALAH